MSILGWDVDLFKPTRVTSTVNMVLEVSCIANIFDSSVADFTSLF